MAAAAPRADAAALEIALARAHCQRLREATSLPEAEKRARVADFHAVSASDLRGRGVPAALSPVSEVVVWLRAASDHPPSVVLDAEFLTEGESAGRARAPGVPAGIGTLQPLSIRLATPIPSRACRDLELDLRLAAGASARFAIEAVELRGDSGPSAVTLFAQPGIIALDSQRPGLSLPVRADACPTS